MRLPAVIETGQTRLESIRQVTSARTRRFFLLEESFYRFIAPLARQTKRYSRRLLLLLIVYTLHLLRCQSSVAFPYELHVRHVPTRERHARSSRAIAEVAGAAGAAARSRGNKGSRVGKFCQRVDRFRRVDGRGRRAPGIGGTFVVRQGGDGKCTGNNNQWSYCIGVWRAVPAPPCCPYFDRTPSSPRAAGGDSLLSSFLPYPPPAAALPPRDSPLVTPPTS